MERDDLAPTHPLAARDRVTRHVMVGFPDPAVRARPPERDEATQRLATARGRAVTISPRMAPDARDGVTPMRGEVGTFLGALAIMGFAAIGAMLVHDNLHNSFGFGAGIFVLAGAFMLYRIFFWHD
jgi:hypothetical protein